MSWQQYVDDNLIDSHKVSQAAILGPDGSTWAASSDFNMVEGAEIANAFNNPKHTMKQGITVNGVVYTPICADHKAIYAKKDRDGVSLEKTGQVIIVGVHDKTIQAGQSRATVAVVADYLRDQGY